MRPRRGNNRWKLTDRRLFGAVAAGLMRVLPGLTARCHCCTTSGNAFGSEFSFYELLADITSCWRAPLSALFIFHVWRLVSIRNGLFFCCQFTRSHVHLQLPVCHTRFLLGSKVVVCPVFLLRLDNINMRSYSVICFSHPAAFIVSFHCF